MHFLIVSANFYKDVSKELLDGATNELDRAGHTYHKISVPGAFEIPAVISFATDTELYDGFIALGCIIKGETYHDEIIAKESARALNDLAINMNLAIGNGILTVLSKKQAMVRAVEKNKGGFAAKTAIKMALIRDKFAQTLKKA